MLHDEPAGLSAVVHDLWIEAGVDLLVAVVDELHAGAVQEVRIKMSVVLTNRWTAYAEQRAVKTPTMTARREIMLTLRESRGYGKNKLVKAWGHYRTKATFYMSSA